MHCHAQPQGGLRLAFADLPPTLQPHAILSIAPRPDRRLSALAATAIYLAVIAGIVLLDRVAPKMGRKPLITDGPAIDLQAVFPKDPPAPTPPAVPVTAVVAPLENLEIRPLQPLSENPPEILPESLPKVSHIADGTRLATDAERLLGRPIGTPAGAPDGTRHVSTPAANPVRDFDGNPPRVLSAVNPIYPSIARITQVQGSLVLLMTIDDHGVPSQVQVLSGHPAFHAEAERAARLWRFEPATMDGRPVPAQFRLTITFRLK